MNRLQIVNRAARIGMYSNEYGNNKGIISLNKSNVIK